MNTSIYIYPADLAGWCVVLGVAAAFHLALVLGARLARALLPQKYKVADTDIDAGLPDYFALSGVPPPTPLLNFDIDSAKPRPYRPFRWQYHQNMSLKKMEPDWWIELESTYRARIAQRIELYVKHGTKVVDALPGSEAACRELAEMVVQFLCARYPAQFQYHARSGVFANRILGTQTVLLATDPLVFLLHNVPEDFLLTQTDAASGLYMMTAGVCCSAVGWNVATKIGKPLHAIHEPVPDYKEKMQFSMDRFFSKMPCDKPIQRGSWSLEVGQPLFLQPEDAEYGHRNAQSPTLAIEDIFLRVDWQTLRRLPRSRAIVFNFKALFTPLAQLRAERYIPRLLATILRDAKGSILEYKGTFHISHVASDALEKWAKEQEERGWVPKDWKVQTLDEDPYFPGWIE